MSLPAGQLFTGRWPLDAAGKKPARLPEIHSGQWSGQWAVQVGNKRGARRMGNQQGKGGKRAAPGQTYPFDEPEKKSRTDWTAGNLGL